MLVMTAGVRLLAALDEPRRQCERVDVRNALDPGDWHERILFWQVTDHERKIYTPDGDEYMVKENWTGRVRNE